MDKPCKARRFSDQMQCGRCGFAWDVNDPEPPQCKPVGFEAAAAKLDELEGRDAKPAVDPSAIIEQIKLELDQ